MNETIGNHNRTIATIHEHIAKENSRLEEFSQGKQEESLHMLEEAREAYKAAEAEIASMDEERLRLIAEQDAAKAKFTALEQDLNKPGGIKSQIEAATRQLQLIDQTERTKLAPFGQNLDKVLTEIPKMRWHGQPPVGPLGQFVKVRDARWAPLLRVRLGSGMSIFAITDPRDRGQLNDLLKHHGK
jgi:structural maintenance of chromosomes protein 6